MIPGNFLDNQKVIILKPLKWSGVSLEKGDIGTVFPVIGKRWGQHWVRVMFGSPRRYLYFYTSSNEFSDSNTPMKDRHLKDRYPSTYEFLGLYNGK